MLFLLKDQWQKFCEGLKQLRDAGIPVIVVNDAKKFAEVYKSIEMIGNATGKQEEAAKDC